MNATGPAQPCHIVGKVMRSGDCIPDWNVYSTYLVRAARSPYFCGLLHGIEPRAAGFGARMSSGCCDGPSPIESQSPASNTRPAVEVQ